MSKISIKLVFSTLFLLLMFSCTAHKGVPIVKKAGDYKNQIPYFELGESESVIKPYDDLTIHVSSTVPGAASAFNIPIGITGGVNDLQLGGGALTRYQSYQVDKNGYIEYPVLGYLKLAGMTLMQAQNYIASQIYPRYLTDKPIVKITFNNFDIAILGDVSRPGVYGSTNGRLTIFNALAMAGDLNMSGKRNNILLMRTEPDGNIKATRFNIQDTKILEDKDLYFLQQGDKIYVEPNKAKANSVNWGGMESLALSLVSISLSAALVVKNW